ncbi:hypothetical protein [Actinoplanes xinjiangensis]|uniref:Uncharacterized protein n=1 Tax=Actinoplanes xinjiangensis TaxID=512350 RepID=A0A316EK01_9ACTN|nr:hypothetical protein [Actinoplanes xinjiangensis]PWK32097.1 hypothetical protein BC793_13193 [Actinoplanes xinjiangensis]GIF43779.1 hypothetical protein Axi01nite_80900 [Actinoplanes xinjiangensis]
MRTVSDGFGDWVDWSPAGLDGVPAAVRNGTVRLTINTGGFVPRYTDSTGQLTGTSAIPKFTLRTPSV